MSVLQDLIEQIDDPILRDRIATEADKLTKSKKFGLVFESHLPECTPLYDMPIKVGSLVALKTGYVSDIYTVINIDGNEAICDRRETHEHKTFSIDEIVAVAEFGEPIYPYLKQIDSICNAPDSDLWHILIEADNYHALQLLEYLYAGKVDCIYIDPPYNTGARDWKYNNDYVDSSDNYRHSKWLSMMEKRLMIAKNLLNPKDSVLIVAIDEKEYLHLGCLLEDIFPEARIQMVSCCITPCGVTRSNEFSRTDEYLFFIKFGSSAPYPLPLGPEWLGNIKSTNKNKAQWDSLLRRGTNNMRIDRPNLFYPIYVSEDGLHFLGAGDPLPLEMNKEDIFVPDDCKVIWPIHSDGSEGCWQIGKETFLNLQENHFVKLGNFTNRGMAISYMKKGEQNKVLRGDYTIQGLREDNSYILDDTDYVPSFIPGTQWMIASHNASSHGSSLLRKIFNDQRFTFPKSLYATHDAIRFFTADKPNALIIDFFAGSGTTLHAVNFLNAEDGGHRRCIIVTNNEVSEVEAKSLTAKGYKPGDDEWEQHGIAQYVAWPRTVCSIEGHDINGQPLKGDYLNSDIAMADGFAANAIYFKLGFLDKTSVALGKQFANLLSVLWMKAGAIGECPILLTDELPQMMILPKNHFAVLLDESAYSEFVQEVEISSDIETIYFVTDSESAYRSMAVPFSDRDTYQLYRDYLDNFRINTGRQ